MNYPLFDFRYCSAEQFISFWKELYSGGKYNDEEYRIHLKLDGVLDAEDITYLWEWKNGVPLSKKKKLIVEKTIKKLNQINAFRKLDKIDDNNFQSFYKLTSEIVGTGLIWRIFIFHIARPGEFPIFDQHVHRTFYFIENRQILPRKTKPKSLDDYLKYRNFFLKLVEESSRDWRDTDKALMAFGQFLKSNFSKTLLTKEV